jgi:hypothetical protein
VSPSDFPTTSPGRFWVISHNAKSETKPVRVELRQRLAGSQVDSLSTLVGFASTIADPDEIVKAANLVNIRAGRIDELVGTYQGRTS